MLFFSINFPQFIEKISHFKCEIFSFPKTSQNYQDHLFPKLSSAQIRPARRIVRTFRKLFFEKIFSKKVLIFSQNYDILLLRLRELRDFLLKVPKGKRTNGSYPKLDELPRNLKKLFKKFLTFSENLI